MKAAADVAAAFGVLYIPPGLTNEEAMIGLHANVNRLRAKQIIEFAQGIGIALGGAGVGREVFRAAGMSDGQIQRLEIDQWKAGKKESA